MLAPSTVGFRLEVGVAYTGRETKVTQLDSMLSILSISLLWKCTVFNKNSCVACKVGLHVLAAASYSMVMALKRSHFYALAFTEP